MENTILKFGYRCPSPHNYPDFGTTNRRGRSQSSTGKDTTKSASAGSLINCRWPGKCEALPTNSSGYTTIGQQPVETITYRTTARRRNHSSPGRHSNFVHRIVVTKPSPPWDGISGPSGCTSLPRRCSKPADYSGNLRGIVLSEQSLLRLHSSEHHQFSSRKRRLESLSASRLGCSSPTVLFTLKTNCVVDSSRTIRGNWLGPESWWRTTERTL